MNNYQNKTLQYTRKIEYIFIGDIMKKILLVILILLTGCSNKLNEHINTIIEEDKNILIGINYPITGINNLDNIIKNDIETIYNEFKDNYENFNSLIEKSELNIDYTYNIVNNNYINICVKVFINSSKLNNPQVYVKTYNYDIKQNKKITVENIIDYDNLKKVTNYLNKKLLNNYYKYIDLDKMKQKIIPNFNNYNLFTFDNNGIIFYFNPDDITNNYHNVISIKIPISEFEYILDLETKQEKQVSKEINIKTKVIDPNQKVIAITFDDGPSKYTNKIIEYLNEEDACATFFILGNKVEIYQNTLKKAIEYGNELGNHSYNHKWLTKLETKDLLLQINQTQTTIQELLNYKPTIFRPTYGSLNNEIRNNINLDIILWNVDTMDWKYKSVDKIVTRATKNIKDGDIILMHDTYERTYKALMKIIPILKEQGFEFVTISELKEINLLRKQQEIE